MAYQHEGFTLYSKNVTLKGGRTQTIYFFSRRTPKSGVQAEIPPGMEVSTVARTGLPVLRKIGGSKWRTLRAQQKKNRAARKERREARIKAEREARKARAAARRAAKTKKGTKTAKPVKKATKVKAKPKGKAKKGRR